jgi:hypothetical protein
MYNAKAAATAARVILTAGIISIFLLNPFNFLDKNPSNKTTDTVVDREYASPRLQTSR